MSRLDAIEERAEAVDWSIVPQDELIQWFVEDIPDLVGLVRTLGEALHDAHVRAHTYLGKSVDAALRLYDEWGSA